MSNNTESSSGDTFIIVTKPETGFLWDQLSQKERLASLKNIITKKLQTHYEEQSIDILVQTINNMYLKEYQTHTNPLNYKYSAIKKDNEKLLAKFKKILHETNWIIPIIFDRRKISSTASKPVGLPDDAIYSTDLRYDEKKIKEYHLNINSKLLRKLQNPYIAPRTLDAKVLDKKIGPTVFDKQRKVIWYVDIPKQGKVTYTEISPRIIIEDDKIYLDGLVIDTNLKQRYDFLKWYISPNVEQDYLTQIQPPLSGSVQKIYHLGEGSEEQKSALIKKTVDRFDLSALQDIFSSDPFRNNLRRKVIELSAQSSKAADDKDQKESTMTDSIYSVRKWPYFIVQFSDITELIGNYPLELSKYDSNTAYTTWLSKDTRVQHLVYLIEKILTDLDVTSIEEAKKKLQSIKAEFEKKQIISKSYCEKEKCPGVPQTLSGRVPQTIGSKGGSDRMRMSETIQHVLDNLTYLVDQYTYYHARVKRNVDYKKLRRQLLDQAGQKKLIHDILEWGVKRVYGADIYNKVVAGEQLTDEQQKKVDQFVINITNRRKAYINNNCPHIPLRKKFDKTRGREEKMTLFDKLIIDFARNPTSSDNTLESPGDHIIECKLCGYQLGCQHEKLLLLESSDKAKAKQYQEELETKFYANSYLDYLQNIISCRECGRKIKDVSIEVQVDYEKDSASNDRSIRTGHAVFGHLDRLAQSELTKILYYTQLRVLYPETPIKLYSQIEPVVEDDLKEVEERLKDKTQAREKRQLIYINAAIIGRLIFDSIKKDFKERLLASLEPLAEEVKEIQQTVFEMQKYKTGDIKKYYVYHNQLIEQAIRYFIKLMKYADKAFVTKIGLDESKFDQIMHAYIKKYYQKFSDRYKFGFNKTKNGMVKFIRRGKIYQIEDTQYQIIIPTNVPNIEKYEVQIKKGVQPGTGLSSVLGLLNYLGNKKWHWHYQNVPPGALLNSKPIIEFNEINTQPLEVHPGIIDRVPNQLIRSIYSEIWQYNSSKNKRFHRGGRVEIVFDLTQSTLDSSKTNSDTSGALGGRVKYIDFNYLLYCPNGRPHLWILKSSKPDESNRECYWCHMSKQEAKERTQKMTDNDYHELQNNIQKQKIIEYFRTRCVDHTPHNLFNGYCLNCGEGYETIFEPNETRIKKLTDAWKNKPVFQSSINKTQLVTPTNDIKMVSNSVIDKTNLYNFVSTMIKNISQFSSESQAGGVKVEKFKSEHGKEVADKLFSKKVKNFKPLIDMLTNDLFDLGYFKRRHDDDIAHVKNKIKDKEELENEINQIKTKFRSEQVKELRGYIETFFQHISIILNNSRSYTVHDISDIDYLYQFIDANEENKDQFMKLQDYFKIENFPNEFSDFNLKSKVKSNILHNILINDLLSKLLVSPFTSLFVFGFIDRILYSFAQIGDKTLEEREFIDLISEEKVLAKRLKFYKKLHEEKVEAGLAFADFEKQEAYFDAEKDTFQIEAEDAPEDEADRDIQQEDDIINDIQLDELDVDGDLFDGGVYEADYADRELVMYGNDM